MNAKSSAAAGRLASVAFRQLGEMLDLRPASKRYRHPSVSEAIRGDWERVGGDMKRAITSVRDRGEASGKK